MRRDLDVVGLGHRRDLLGFEDAAGAAEIRLQDGRGAILDDAGEFPFVVSRSPVAIGIEVPRATWAITSGMSGGTGSSNQSGS
jgi:hypothetical protein